ncbi:ATP-binding protein [Duganella sp. PWIR1]
MENLTDKSSQEHVKAKEKPLSAKIIDARESGNSVETVLKTDDRVIARVTDGIYRQPGSALRELISNAYDADASKIYIDTDAPRFSSIKITDDGVGMSPEVLARLLEHIGGSSKRTMEGSENGVTSSVDPTISKNKNRKLIGKIGIGLFSVAQLTQKFQIITKVQGDSYRTVASVVMKTYTEEDLKTIESGGKFESGRVTVWSEHAEDVESHGTTIILSDLKPQARDTLRSKDIWTSIEEADAEDDGMVGIDPPLYHIGHVDPQTGEQITNTAQLPWETDDTPELKFEKLVNSVWEQVHHSNPNPKITDLFDNYLQMVWNLGLSAPIPYVDGDLFDVTFEEDIKSYSVVNYQKKGAAQEVDVPAGKTIRQTFQLSDAIEGHDKFEVFLDGLKLARPLRFANLPTTAHAIKNPLIFVGKCLQPFSSISKEISGGPLEFEAYLFWTPKIAPREHRGALVRINGASGTLFDPSFMRYQTAEIARMNQITCEIFVRQGLDGALNIDRESFNFAHPHYVFLARWLHSALKQVTNTQKKVATDVRKTTIVQRTDDAIDRLHSVVEKEWVDVGNDPDELPPPIVFQSSEKKDLLSSQSDEGAYVFSREIIFSETSGKRGASASTSGSKVFEEKLKSIAQVLAAYGVFDSMSKSKQERLLRAIGDIMSTGADE